MRRYCECVDAVLQRMTVHLVSPPLWIADQARNDVTRGVAGRGSWGVSTLWILDQVQYDVTRGVAGRVSWGGLACFTLTLVLSHQGRGGYGWFVFVLVHPHHTPPLWIAGQARNDGPGPRRASVAIPSAMMPMPRMAMSHAHE